MTKSIAPSSANTRLVPPTWELPESITARLGKSAGRQRLIAEEGHVLLVLHQLPEPEEHERRPLLVWRSAEGAWRAASSGKEGPSGEGLTALRHHLGHFFTRLAELDARADGAKGAADYFAVLGAAQPLHRTARNLHRALQELREQLEGDPEIVALRDRAYDIERTAELLVEDAKNGLEFTVAKESEAQSKVSLSIAEESRRLNALAAVCLPLSALSAVVGASIPTGLELLPAPGIFWFLIAGALALGFALRRSIQVSPR